MSIKCLTPLCPCGKRTPFDDQVTYQYCSKICFDKYRIEIAKLNKIKVEK